MRNLFVGAILAILVLGGAFLKSSLTLKSLFNPEGLIIVVCGTFAVLFTNSKMADFRSMMNLVRHAFSGSKDRRKNLKSKIMEITNEIARGRMPEETGYLTLNKGLTWISAGLTSDQLDDLLNEAARQEAERISRGAVTVLNLGKYPPALGMIGTVFGIIGIFGSLGSSEGQRFIGVNLAVAMTATLYGLVLSNFIIQPVGELLEGIAREHEEDLAMMVEAVRLWHRRETPFYVQEQMDLYEVA